MSPMSKPASYSEAGVNLSAGDETVRRLAPRAKRTHAAIRRQGAQVLADIGGFAAAVTLPSGLREPVLVSATDGVGTKLELARAHGALATIGRDLVAMCVNDLLCAGARPLLFLDYYACGELSVEAAVTVVDGIAGACEESECALVGGETAEMPGVYDDGRFDLAGFAVGVCERSEMLPAGIEAGDAIIGVASDGAHSNGYSLIRKLLAGQPELANRPIDGKPLIDCLLTPTRLYVRSVNALRQRVAVRGLAHITGGGLRDNLSRILPDSCQPHFFGLPMPALFAALQQAGELEEEEMRRVFNCGVGMAVVVRSDDADTAIEVLRQAGEDAEIIGEIRAVTHV